MTTESPAPRYYAFDSLRASVMLLVIVLHSLLSYSTGVRRAYWPFRDSPTRLFFDADSITILLVIMPVFFIMGGFFGALLLARSGVAGMIKNRVQRLVVPMIIFWPVVFPLTQAGFRFARSDGGAAGVQAAWGYIISGRAYGHPSLLHLWFIYDVLIFYAVALITYFAAKQAPEAWRMKLNAGFGQLATSGWGPFVLSLVTALTVLREPALMLAQSDSFTPPLRVLLCYGVFFAFGWLLYGQRDVLDRAGRPWSRYAALAAGFIALYLYVYFNPAILGRTANARLAGVGILAMAIWLTIYAMIGICMQLLNRPSPVWRYLSDASYWMYLVHLPFTIWIPGLLDDAELPPEVKFLIVISATIAITLSTYHFFVRSTAIGALLSGQRYQKSLPNEIAPGLPSEEAA